MVLLLLIVPLYIFVAEVARGATTHIPELPIDRAIPLRASWSIVYGALYLYLILLPVFVVRGRRHVSRTFSAYLSVWLASYVVFLLYPTAAPRPELVEGSTFATTGLRFLYAADPPYNCFPSIHVAHSFVSALTCLVVHRRLGIVTLFAAATVAISTLFTRQHYVLDVIAGAALALVAFVVFLRNVETDVTTIDRESAPILAGLLFGVILVAVGAMWLAYQIAHS